MYTNCNPVICGFVILVFNGFSFKHYFVGVEKLNDDCRRIHLHRSNKWDAPKDVLLVEKRIEHLAECERTPRQYVKQNAEYWGNEIRVQRAKRKRISCELLPEDNLQNASVVDIESLSIVEVKSKLKEMGIVTRLRSEKKIKELLRKTINDANM